MGNFIDLTGQKFGRLTVLRLLYKTKSQIYWECRCDCGKIVKATRQALRSGAKKSCGCYHHDYVIQSVENMHKLNKKENEITICNNYAKVKLSNCDEYALIDIDDIEKIKPFYWHKTEYGYVKTNKSDGKNHKALRLHKLIIEDVPKGYTIDHINQNKLDNRKCNLRIVTQMVNNNNNCKTKPRSTTGLKYIYEKGKKYSVKYSRYGKKYYVGIFNTIEEAKLKLNESFIKNNFKELINYE